MRLPAWVQLPDRGTALSAYLLPLRFGRWLLGPGWVNLPIQLGPGVLANLADWQMDPIELERLLQGRSDASDEDESPPDDGDLETRSSA